MESEAMAIVGKIYRTISSMKTGLILLGLIAITAAAGTIFLPDTFFQTSLFKWLLLLLFINMASCVIKQISQYLERRFKGRRIRQPWFRSIGILLLHIGIVLVLIGGAANAYYGQTALVGMIDGDTADISSLMKTKQPLQMHLNQFHIDFNADGSASQYYSLVKVVNGNIESKDFSISVNHPLNYAGIKAYQESFAYLVKMEGDFESGTKMEKVLKEGDIFDIPGSDRQVELYKYIPNFDPNNPMNTRTLKPDNPRLIVCVYENKKRLGIGVVSFGERIEISSGKYIEFTGVQPYTLLRLKSDPGIPLAAAGGLMVMAGVCLALLFTPLGQKDRCEPEEQIQFGSVRPDMLITDHIKELQ